MGDLGSQLDPWRGRVAQLRGSGYMDFTSDHYFRAALERMSQAHRLYRAGSGNYALAMYAAGLAIECMLRAFMLRRGKSAFESRHNMLLLAKESGILNRDRDRLRQKGLSDEHIERHQKALWASVNDAFILWRNSYRFASEARLLAHLKRMRLYEGVKGDLLKASALRLLKAAQQFMDKGVLQWR
jgi:HEPN domain